MDAPRSQHVGIFLRAGYKYGTSFIDTVFNSGLMQSLTKAAGVMGITMVGAMVASSVNVKLAWTINVGEASVVVLDILDSIIPGLLSIVLVFVLMKLIKKGYKPLTLVFGILILSIVLAFLGIF